VDVGGHSTPSGQQIWTLRDVPGYSGNTPKVPESRPGRPTESLIGSDIIPLAIGNVVKGIADENFTTSRDVHKILIEELFHRLDRLRS
jgi:hypothetical protein